MDKITTFISQNWKHPVAIALYVVLGIVIIYVVLNKFGVFDENGSDGSGNTDTPPPPAWELGLTPEEKLVVSERSERLFKDMDSTIVGLGLSPRDVQVYIDLANLNDKMTKAIHEHFGKNFGGGKPLGIWIADESNLPGSTQTIIGDKLKRLNLT